MDCETSTDQTPLILPLEVVELPARAIVSVDDDRKDAIISDARTKVIVSGGRGPQGPQGIVGERSKAGWITYTSFVGNPKKAPVRFDIPFVDTNYGIVVGGQDTRQWSIEEQTPEGFVINSNANQAITSSVFWNATSKWG